MKQVLLLILLLPATFELVVNGDFEDLGAGWNSWGAVDFIWNDDIGWYVAMGTCQDCYEGISQQLLDMRGCAPYEFTAEVLLLTEGDLSEQHAYDYAQCRLWSYELYDYVGDFFFWSSEGGSMTDWQKVTTVLEEPLPNVDLHLLCVMDTNEDDLLSTFYLRFISLQSSVCKGFFPVVRK